jgi:hypothetical protein
MELPHPDQIAIPAAHLPVSRVHVPVSVWMSRGHDGDAEGTASYFGTSRSGKRRGPPMGAQQPAPMGLSAGSLLQSISARLRNEVDGRKVFLTGV